MLRKNLILGVLIGCCILIYYFLTEILSRFFHYHVRKPTVSIPIVYGAIVSVLSYSILGIKNGLIAIILIVSSLGMEHLLENKSKQEVQI